MAKYGQTATCAHCRNQITWWAVGWVHMRRGIKGCLGVGSAGKNAEPWERAMNNDDAGKVELPRWKCHKEVWAFKITGIEHDTPATQDSSYLLHHSEGYFLPVRVDADYMQRHQPKVGGYYVSYKDGYRSYSPAEAFEDGYERIY